MENHLTLVGPSGSGKTALFYNLYTNEFRNTVSSIDENLSGVESIKINSEEQKQL